MHPYHNNGRSIADRDELNVGVDRTEARGRISTHSPDTHGYTPRGDAANSSRTFKSTPRAPHSAPCSGHSGGPARSSSSLVQVDKSARHMTSVTHRNVFSEHFLVATTNLFDPLQLKLHPGIFRLGGPCLQGATLSPERMSSCALMGLPKEV